jgi:hypothetical protein
LLILALVAGAGLAVWWTRPELLDRFRGRRAPEAVVRAPSPELADSTLDRFESFRSGEVGPEMRLGGAELSSLVRYSLPGLLPPAIEAPSVRLQDGRIHLAARVAVEALPQLPALREVMGLLPDTVLVEIRGTLAPLADEFAALHVDRIEASRIPLPARYIPEILTALGRRSMENLPPDALLIPLPQGLRTAYVLRDSLVLVSNR